MANDNRIPLDLLAYQEQLKTRRIDQKTYLFDRIRKKWLVVQPEELVRQLMICYLITEKGYNPNRFSLEKGVKVLQQDRRFDIMVYDPVMKPFLILECKAPKVSIRQETFSQIHAYNYALKVPYLVVTNGIRTYGYCVDWEEERMQVLGELPEYPQEAS